MIEGDSTIHTDLPSPTTVRSLIKLLRVKQWSKNLLVFAAFLFTGAFSHRESWILVLLTFTAMCMASSGTYVVNDIVDADRDRLHPSKRLRPMASGQISTRVGIALAVLLLVGSVLLSWSINLSCVSIVVAYLGLQVLYNLWLKLTPVADVYCIATGFVLRAVLGAAAISVTISPWLLLCTGALALMLGFAKRRNEFILQGEARTATRESLAHYNQLSLDVFVTMFACAAALFYGLYTIQSETAHRFPGLIMTAPFVFYGITRYVLLVFTQDEGGEPAEVLFKDRHIVITLILFVVAAGLAVSGVSLPLLEK